MFRCRNVSMRVFSRLFTTDLVANDYRVFDWLGAEYASRMIVVIFASTCECKLITWKLCFVTYSPPTHTVHSTHIDDGC